MPLATPFHARTEARCESRLWKEWAGYHAVRSYETHPDAEYQAIRHGVALIDVSPLFKIEIKGKDASRFLSWIVTRDTSRLRPGRVVYTSFCDNEGKLVDDGNIVCLAPNHYRLTTASPSYYWLQRYATPFTVEVEDVSAQLAALAVQGPRARELLLEVCSGDTDRQRLTKLRYFRCCELSLGDEPLLVTRTGYTGDLGYELWLAPERALTTWDRLMQRAPRHGGRPVGLDALDVARLEAGYVLQDVDYYSAPRCATESRKSSPFEAGLGWTVDLARSSFLGQDALLSERRRGSKWALVGLQVSWEQLEKLYDRYQLPPALSSRAWRQAIPVYRGRRQVGHASSGVWSPTLKKNIALATVEARYAQEGTALDIEHTVEYTRHTVAAHVVKRPFFDPERKRQ